MIRLFLCAFFIYSLGLFLLDQLLYLFQGQCPRDADQLEVFLLVVQQHHFLDAVLVLFQVDGGLFSFVVDAHQFFVAVLGVDERGLFLQLVYDFGLVAAQYPDAVQLGGYLAYFYSFGLQVGQQAEHRFREIERV